MATHEFDLLATPPQVALANFYPFATDERIGPHWSESDLFLPATHGRGVVEVGPEQFELSAGQVLHVPWASPIRYLAAARDPFVLIGLHFKYLNWDERPAYPLHTSRDVDTRRRSMQAAPSPQPFSGAFLLRPPPESPLISLGIAIAKTYESPPAKGPAAAALREERDAGLRALALQFLIEARRLHRGEEGGGRHPLAGVVREIISWLELSYRKPIRRAEMAERAGISESALAGAFRAVVGKAPVDFLIDLRLNHARSMLATSRRRVGEIAEEVGIPDVYYFSKLFKRRVGLSPLQYRQQRRF